MNENPILNKHCITRQICVSQAATMAWMFKTMSLVRNQELDVIVRFSCNAGLDIKDVLDNDVSLISHTYLTARACDVKKEEIPMGFDVK